MSEKFTIMKLTGSENYASWSADLKIVLKHHRHWSWIEGVNEHPPPKLIPATAPKATSALSPQTMPQVTVAVPVATTTAVTTLVENPAYTTWEDGANDTMYHIMMTCKSNIKDQIHHMTVPSEVWKKLKDLYKPSNLSMQFDYLSAIWNITLNDYQSVTAYCSALETASSNYSASRPPGSPAFDSHMLTLVALMGLPSSYKVTQCNILS